MRKMYCLFIIVCLFVASGYGFSVSGNKILDQNGNQVLLRGVDRPSLEWSINGENLSYQDYTLMKGWGANIVRVATNQDFWLGSSGTSYQSLVAQQVEWITSLGMAVIIDLHWNNGGQQVMADSNSITFWTQVATKFKNHPSILFELYNEPHDISWYQWLHGGGGNIVGMQQLYDAVRATGANNVVVAGGLNWAFDLSGVLNGYSISGFNIAYATHPYDFGGKQPGDWPNAFGNLAARYPVIMTEFGENCSNCVYVKNLLEYAKNNGIHWTAWAWYVSGCSFPSIIADWEGNPTQPVGALVKTYLQASTGAPAPPASGSLAVFTDSLQNGFQDWSWSTDKSFSDDAHVHSGLDSIRFALQNYEAIYFHTDSHFQLGSYGSFQFYIYSPNYLSANTIGVVLYDENTNKIGSVANPPNSLSANTWTFVSVSVSAFGISLSTSVSGIAIQGITQNNIGDVWIDDIYFVPSS